MFKDIFAQLGSQLRGMGGESNHNSQSERLRVTKERLKKKMAEKEAKKKAAASGQSSNGMD
jgi:hypothetical protein